MKKLLVAFDFDHTILDENSDIVVRKLIAINKIPEEVRQLHKPDNWTAYMQQIFCLLHSNNILQKDILGAVNSSPVVPNINLLLKMLKRADCEVVIISDSNSVFITEWLKHHSLEDTVTQIFTNPAHFDEHGLLHVEMFHVQDWCKLSSKNLCKGHILQSYIRDRQAKADVHFERVAYIGDGKNDLCPSLKLSSTDLIFPRVGYSLIECLKSSHNEVKASVHPWTTGSDIMDILGEIVGK